MPAPPPHAPLIKATAMLSVVPFEDHVRASPSPRKKKGSALSALGQNTLTPGRKPGGGAKDKEHTPTKLDLGAAPTELQAPVSATKQPRSAESRCTMLQQVVVEARKTIEEQESVNGELISTIQRMKSTVINAQEDAEEYRTQHDHIFQEGQALCAAYATKCEKVKMLTASLNELCTQSAEERQEFEATLKAANEENEEARVQWRHHALTMAHEATKALQQQAPPETGEQECQTESSALTRPVGMPAETECISPDSTRQKLESAAISNEILRDELERQALAGKQRQATMQQQLEHAQSALKAASGTSEAELEASRAEAGALRAQLEQQRSHVQALLQEADLARAEAEEAALSIADAERQGGAARAAEEARAGAEQALQLATAAHGERDAARDAHVSRLEGDLRLMYRKHKEELSTATQRYQAGPDPNPEPQP